MSPETTVSLFHRIFNLKTLLILAFVTQTCLFVAIAYKTQGTWLRGDNTLYETPAQNLANGHGLSSSRNQWEDPYLTELYYTAHPEKANDEFIPATTFAIGYSIFLGGVYSIFGRSLLAGIVANLFLLYVFLTACYFLIKRVFGEELEAKIAFLFITSFPLWAFWATAIMSDTLHLTLLTLFALSFFRKDSTLLQLILSGVLLGLAATVRPYAILFPIFFAIAGWLFRCSAFNLRKVGIVAVICWAIIGCWVVRNYYQFNKPMLTSMTLGYHLWISSNKEIFNDDSDEAKLAEKTRALGYGDPGKAMESRRYLDLAIERIKQNPVKHFLATMTSTVRLWISLGGGNFPVVGKIALAIYLVSLLVLTIMGIWLSRKSADPVIVGSIVIVAYYTMVFMNLGCEGRYVLPARFFSFLLGAVAAAYLLRRLSIVQKFAVLPPAAPSETVS